MKKAPEKVKQEHAMLALEIRKHDQLYYGENAPIISDAQYDELYKKLQDLEEQYPWLKSDDSPLKSVAHASSTFSKIKHDTPLLSLDKAHTEKDIVLFLRRIQKATQSSSISFMVQPKIDGLAVSIVYKDGALKTGKTRGDGMVGEDITQNILAVTGVPSQLNAKISCEIRGEVYISKEDFLQLNATYEKEGRTPFVNPRNAASGSLRQLDVSITQCRPLRFIAYSVYGLQFDTEEQSLQWLAGMRFSPPEYYVAQTKEDIIHIYEKIASRRDSYKMDIDGVVYKVNQRMFHTTLGSTAHHPRWAIAYKFPAHTGITQLRDITLQVGKSGAITPVAQLSPITIGGVTITRASLHNFVFIKEKNICLSDHVVVKRAGDVIPYVDRVHTHTKNARAYVPPTHCPACHHTLQTGGEEERVLYCKNPSCPEQKHQKLVHFCSKSGLNIQSLGKKQIAQLQKLGIANNYEDIFTFLQKNHLHEKLEQQPGWGKKSVSALLESIHQSKVSTMVQILSALSIPHIGPITAQSLAQICPTLKDLLHTVKQDNAFEIFTQSGIGKIVSKNLCLFFAKQENQHAIEALHKHIIYKAIHTKKEALTFTLTGTLKQLTRSEAAALIEKKGHVFSPSLSKKTTFLVCGDNSGSKREQALQQGIPCISEKEFLQKMHLLPGKDM